MIKDPAGIVLMVIGVVFWIKPVMVWFINLQNKLRGSQPNITNFTIWYYRLLGLASIVIGVIIFFSKK